MKSKGTASWTTRYRLYGKRRQYKIGGYGKDHEELFDLEDAIKLTIDCRQKLNDGIDNVIQRVLDSGRSDTAFE